MDPPSGSLNATAWPFINDNRKMTTCATVTHQQEGKEQSLSSHLYLQCSLCAVPVPALLCTSKELEEDNAASSSTSFPFTPLSATTELCKIYLLSHQPLLLTDSSSARVLALHLPTPWAPHPRAELPGHQHPSRPASAPRQHGSPQQATPSRLLAYKGKLLLPHFSSSTLQPRLAGRWSVPPN